MHFRATLVGVLALILAAGRTEAQEAGFFDGAAHDRVGEHAGSDKAAAGQDAGALGQDGEAHTHEEKTKEFLKEINSIFSSMPQTDGKSPDYSELMRRFDEIVAKHGDGKSGLDRLFQGLGSALDEDRFKGHTDDEDDFMSFGKHGGGDDHGHYHSDGSWHAGSHEHEENYRGFGGDHYHRNNFDDIYGGFSDDEAHYRGGSYDDVNFRDDFDFGGFDGHAGHGL